MCWTNHLKIAACVADKDIPVFKICHYLDSTSICGYYTYFHYELNKVYELEKELVLCHNSYTNKYEISAGFHSYNKNCSATKRDNILKVTSHQGDLLDNYNPWCIKVCGYIPKGSHYYLNDRGEYVSDAIFLIAIENL